MAKTNGTQTVETIVGRRIVLSSCSGKTNLDELNWLTDTVLSSASTWKRTGWAYIADCSKMTPVTPAEGGALVKMTKSFVESGCKAFAFVEGSSIMLKAQTAKNTERSDTGVLEGHFATREEALAWIKAELAI